MADPNVVNVTTITAKTDVLQVPATPTAIVTNPALSGQVFKINVLSVANIHASADYLLTVDLYRSTTATHIGHDLDVPVKTSLVVVDKNTSIYLQEGDALRLTANTAGVLEAVCSYEIISAS